MSPFFVYANLNLYFAQVIVLNIHLKFISSYLLVNSTGPWKMGVSNRILQVSILIYTMKNLLLSIFVFFTSFVISQCTHTIKLTDTWGDGWNGGAVSVSVNGAVVLNNITITAIQGGLTPINYNFTVSTGQTIRVWRTLVGSYPSEMRVQIVNNSGTVLIATVQPLTGTATSGGHTCSASCAVASPGCTNASSFGSAVAPPTPTTVTISSCNFQSEYSTVSGIVAGRTYQFGYSLGGYITVHTGTYNGPIVAYGNAPLNWASSYTGTVYVHYNTNSSCGTATSCGTSTVSCVTCAPPPAPANDLVCNATSISCSQTIAGTTVNATTSGYGELGSCGVVQSYPGVWYKVIGNGQIMTASLCATAWDSKISVFSGTCSSLTCVGGNDDNGPGCAGTSASYSWNSVNGTTYWILVYGYSSNSAFSLSLNCVNPPTPGPCTNTTSYGTQFMPVFGGAPYESVYCQYAGEYSTWYNAITNTPYVATSSVNTDWITVRQGTYNGTVLATGTAVVNFTPNITGTIFIHVNTNAYCAVQSTCRDVAVSRISALPIELLYLEGDKESDYNLIRWSTATEHNTSHFVVEKSEDGYEWNLLGQVTASQNSTQEVKYDLIDQNVKPIFNYYRLKQYDIDGMNQTYGPIKIDNRQKEKKILYYINTLGQMVTSNTKGLIFEVYEDGTMKKIIN